MQAVPNVEPIHVLPLASIGHLDRGWTRGHMTGSFDDMRGTPAFLELPPLMLCGIQDIDPGAGYPMHHHQGVETITIILAGALEHEDDLGGRGITGPEDVAVVSAGRGLSHAEFAAPGAALRAVIVWVRARDPHAEPRFEKRTFARTTRRGRLTTVASGRHPAAAGAIPLDADVAIATCVLGAGQVVEYDFARERRGYVVSTDSAIDVDGRVAAPGDRVLLAAAGTVRIRALAATELILIDL